jgi:hypothetical protein
MPRTTGRARYYIYRNLNQGACFSVKHRGRVILVTDQPIVAKGVIFSVSENGWKRARAKQSRNVHAYVITRDFRVMGDASVEGCTEVWYNPFKVDTPHFRLRRGNGSLCVKEAPQVIFKDGKAWI